MDKINCSLPYVIWIIRSCNLVDNHSHIVGQSRPQGDSSSSMIEPSRRSSNFKKKITSKNVLSENT